MLNLTGKSMNFNAESNVDGDIALVMSANYNGDNIYFNKSISSVATYLAHKETADADYAEFERLVIRAVESVNLTTAATHVVESTEAKDAE